MHIQWHTSQGCFRPRVFFDNSVLNLLPVDITCIDFTLLTRIFRKVVSGVVTDYPSVVWG